jgi:hypothetical protein
MTGTAAVVRPIGFSGPEENGLRMKGRVANMLGSLGRGKIEAEFRREGEHLSIIVRKLYPFGLRGKTDVVLSDDRKIMVNNLRVAGNVELKGPGIDRCWSAVSSASDARGVKEALSDLGLRLSVAPGMYSLLRVDSRGQ